MKSYIEYKQAFEELERYLTNTKRIVNITEKIDAHDLMQEIIYEMQNIIERNEIGF